MNTNPLRAALYDAATSYCVKITKRLECINRELDELHLPADGVHPDIRDVVLEALTNHIAECE